MIKTRHFILSALALLMTGFLLGRFSLSYKSAVPNKLADTDKLSLVMSDGDQIKVKVPTAKTTRKKDFNQIESEVESLTKNLSSEASFDELSQKLIDWAASDSNGALNYAHENFSNERQSLLLDRILASLAKSTPQVAWDWTYQNVPHDLQHLDTVLDEIGKTDAETAWRFAEQYAATYTNDAYNAYIGAIRGVVYSGNYEMAAHLMKDSNLVTASGGNYDLPALVASQWAQYQPQKAATWVISLPGGTSRAEALLQIGNSWAQTDPQAAADFAVNLPADDTRQRVVTQTVQSWAEKDPIAAAGWINKFGPSPEFDQALMTISTSPQADTPTAISWANSITQKELRMQSLTRIIWAWMGKDQAAAVNYLQSSTDLPTDERNDIQQRIQTQSAQ